MAPWRIASIELSSVAWPVIDDDLRLAFARRRVAQQLEPVAVGQDQVEQDHVRRRAEQIARALQRIGAGGGEAVVGDELRQRFGGVRVVVDDQCVRHRVSGRRNEVVDSQWRKERTEGPRQPMCMNLSG